MKVISLKNTSKLVKGSVYDVLRLDNKSNGRYFRPKILIKLNENGIVCWCNISNFKLENGDDIPEIIWTDPSFESYSDHRNLRIDKDNPPKVGEYVKYKNSSHKSLETGKIYQISQIKENKTVGFSGGTYVNYEIKVEGSSRFIKSYSFRKCSTQELREISLNQVMELSTGVCKVDKSKRKIDSLEEDEKKKVIMKHFLMSCVDNTRNNLSIIDWACSKLGPKLSLKKDDFDFIMDMSVKDIIDTLN